MKKVEQKMDESSTQIHGGARPWAWILVAGGIALVLGVASTRLAGPESPVGEVAETVELSETAGTDDGAASTAKSTARSAAKSEIDSEAARETRRAERPERLRRSIWWNSPPMVQRLGLVPAQRDAMDEVLAETLGPRAEAVEGRRAAQARFAAALVAADAAAARAAFEERDRLDSALARLEAEMKIQVFEVLDEDQRRILESDHPAVLHRPWLRGGG